MNLPDLIEQAYSVGIEIEDNGVGGCDFHGNLDGNPEVVDALRENERAVYRLVTGIPEDEDLPPETGRVDIEIIPEHHVVIDQVMDVLRTESSLFRNDAGLCHIAQDEDDTDDRGIHRKHGTPRIRPMSPALLKETMSRRICFYKMIAQRGGRDLVADPMSPPPSIVEGIHQRGIWPGIRVLEGVTEVPLLRRDRSIHNKPGYDIRTRKFYCPSVVIPSMIPDPNHEDADAMAAVILDLVSDFSLKTPDHKAAWLAGLLSMFARPAYDGPTPMFLMDANVRGCGKSLLTDIIGIITTGRPMPRFANPANDDECRKRILGIALNGDQAVLIDNVGEDGLGTPALDAAMTSEVWRDRLLGATKIVEAPLQSVWFASGNNVSLNGDMSRRVCHIRIESDREHPEERAGFKYPHLLEHVREHRGEYIGACLTILAAYFREGCLKMDIKPWGSYDGWSRLVRECVYWAIGADPGETRNELRLRSDDDASDLAMLLDGWEQADPQGLGMTAGEAVERANSRSTDGALRHPALASAVSEVATIRGAANSRSLGAALRKFEKSPPVAGTSPVPVPINEPSAGKSNLRSELGLTESGIESEHPQQARNNSSKSPNSLAA